MPEDDVYLFQYGSNMDESRLNSPNRLNGAAQRVGVGRLDGWGVTFDLYSETNACGVTDIIKRKPEHVLGIVYKIKARDLATVERFEGVRPDGTGNYQRCDVTVTVNGQPLPGVTYVGTPDGRRRFNAKTPAERRVSVTYFGYLLNGAKALPPEYTTYLTQQAGQLKP